MTLERPKHRQRGAEVMQFGTDFTQNPRNEVWNQREEQEVSMKTASAQEKLFGNIIR